MQMECLDYFLELTFKTELPNLKPDFYVDTNTVEIEPFFVDH